MEVYQFNEGVHMNNNSPHNSNFSQGISNEDLLKLLGEKVEANLQNEQFNVEELARQMHMSRSQLHRKLKRVTSKSANQFIREYRLNRAIDKICNENKTISEVAFEVGFGSVSYFTTCFTAFYNQSPGEVRRNYILISNQETTGRKLFFNRLQKYTAPVIFIGSLIMLSILSGIYVQRNTNANSKIKNVTASYETLAIAVLPFTNLNNDHEYEYFRAGVVEAINRQILKLGILEVVSLNTAAYYEKSNKPIREIGNELLVAYLLEGSFQHSGNRIRLEVRLIDTANELQLWAESYDRELNDIFKTQTEIAEQVTQALVKIFSSVDKKSINVPGTSSIVADDLSFKRIY